MDQSGILMCIHVDIHGFDHVFGWVSGSHVDSGWLVIGGREFVTNVLVGGSLALVS